jgi:asparagine synthase (glutamine-hydrolysing)
MCGITGVYNYRDHRPVDRPLMGRMLASIVHRGPDDEGTYFSDVDGVALGNRRLSIIDLAGGHQPMCNEDERIWVAFNGEIYNYRELREQLKALSHSFRTASDTEVILHCYEQWGVDGFSRLNGIFGLAIWDGRSRTLTLARDPFGVKPLYYWDDGAGLVFGSEARTILCHPRISAEVDPSTLGLFISLGFVPSPRTMFKGIQKLMPGSALQCTGSGIRTLRFARRGRPVECRGSEHEIAERLADGIDAAVRRQMVSDVPIGVMLSGGVDSTTVATIVAQAANRPIDTFTVGMKDFPDISELVYARQIARRIGSTHHEVEVSSDTYREFLPLSIEYLEEPVATGSTLAYYTVCKLARESVKVVLTGQGADEPFGGYGRYLGERYSALYRRIPSVVRRSLIAPLVNGLPRNEQLKRAVHSLGIDDDTERMSSIYGVVDETVRHALFRDGVLPDGADDVRDSIGIWDADVRDAAALDRMLYIDARFSLSDNLLLYGDKMSMAVSLEARVPFLDIELMELVESIPASLKIKGFVQKHILKRAVSRWTPQEVIQRKKIGFAVPFGAWAQGDLYQDMRDRFEAAGSGCRTYFDLGTINRIMDDHRTERHDYKRILFSLLTFEIWHDIFIRNRHAIGARG